MFDPQTFEDTHNATFSQALASGLMPCETRAGWTPKKSGQVAAHASLSPAQAKEAGLLTSGTCGPTSTGSLNSAALQQSLESRLRAKLSSRGSTLYKLTWKSWVTPSGVSRSRLRGAARRCSETERSGWPTPATRDHKGGYQGGRIRNGKISTDTLDVAAQLSTWPTPTCQSPNSLRGKGQDPEKRKAGGHSVNLTDAVRYLEHNQPARLTASGVMLTGSSAEMESGGQLNPAHSRWLMGLPPEWCDCAPTATRSTRKQRTSSSKAGSKRKPKLDPLI